MKCTSTVVACFGKLDLCVYVGPAGSPGAQGPQGVAGLQGAPGFTGFTGERGSTGEIEIMLIVKNLHNELNMFLLS